MEERSHAEIPGTRKTLLSSSSTSKEVYGTLAMMARDHDTLEMRLGDDFVRVTRTCASQVAQALECFAGPSPEGLVEVEVETEEERNRRRAGP